MFRSCPWEVHKFADYRTFQSSGSSDQTAIHLLLHVNATGQAVEGFRCTVEGPVITTDFRGTDIFTLELLLDYQFKYDIDAHNVDIKTNCFTSKWQDFEDLLARGFISAYLPGQNDDKASDVRRIFDNVRAGDKEFGASLRWAVQAKDKDSLQLVLQCLPKTANALKRDSRLSTDDCPAINLESTTARTTFSSGNSCKGPKPVLFARDPDQVQKILHGHPEVLYSGKIDDFYWKIRIVQNFCLNKIKNKNTKFSQYAQ